MKCLLDENVSRSVGNVLRHLGCEVLSVRQFVSARAPDHEVFLQVRKQPALFVTHDRAFTSTRKIVIVPIAGTLAERDDRPLHSTAAESPVPIARLTHRLSNTR